MFWISVELNFALNLLIEFLKKNLKNVGGQILMFPGEISEFDRPKVLRVNLFQFLHQAIMNTFLCDY